MKTIPLTKGFVAIVDDEDYERINQHSWQSLISPYSSCPYARRSIYLGGGRKYHKVTGEMMHRVIMGAKPGEFVDHINGDGLDNRRCNLRLCTKLQNRRNSRRRRTDCGSRFKGVVWRENRGKWVAQIYISKGRKRILGHFVSEVEAAIRYDSEAKKLHGEFAYVNGV